MIICPTNSPNWEKKKEKRESPSSSFQKECAETLTLTGYKRHILSKAQFMSKAGTRASASHCETHESKRDELWLKKKKEMLPVSFEIWVVLLSTLTFNQRHQHVDGWCKVLAWLSVSSPFRSLQEAPLFHPAVFHNLCFWSAPLCPLRLSSPAKFLALA